MLVLTVNPGDQVVIATPDGVIRLAIGERRRRLSIDAPEKYAVKVLKAPRPQQRPAADTEPKEPR